MSKTAWFKFYPSDFLDGTRFMTANEVGDYIRLLAFIYDQGGKVPNDPYLLRHLLLRCQKAPDAVKRVQRLIDIHKLSTDGDGNLHNGRADSEIGKPSYPSSYGSSYPSSYGSSYPSGTPKKSMNTTRARPQAHDRVQNPDNNKDLFNGSALPPSPGLGGRSEAAPEETLTADEIAAIKERLSWAH